jgi:hypothetical protein
VKDLDLSGAQALLRDGVAPPKILVLYGSLRSRSYSKLLAFEMARVLDLLGADVHVFDPSGLPMKDDRSENHPRVQEIRRLSQWSEGQVWVCPEQHGALRESVQACVRVVSGFIGGWCMDACMSQSIAPLFFLTYIIPTTETISPHAHRHHHRCV